MEWYEVKNIDTVDSPAVIIYPGRVKANIAACLGLVKSPDTLRPHVKTNKIAEVCQLMIDAGITKFKCATIAEAEMLGQIGAADVLLAYQPVGPKIDRYLTLINVFPDTRFSCLLDNEQSASALAEAASAASLTVKVFIDVNTGMDRTGILPSAAFDLYKYIIELPALAFAGLHAYDGHLHDPNPSINEHLAVAGFAQVQQLHERIVNHIQPASSIGISKAIPAKTKETPVIVAGGSVTFPVYRSLDVECSPGTFVFWDWSYKNLLPDEPFDFAAVIITRVISVVGENLITTDLGHKSVASENPLPRIHFLNAPNVIALGHSEEHLVLQVPDQHSYKPGDVLYGIPMHVCPSISMYEEVFVASDGVVTGKWQVISRNKKITI